MTRAETAVEQENWRNAFAQRVEQHTGAPVHRGFDWHAFSEGFVYALSGDDALNSYRSHAADQLVVLPNLESEVGFRCSGATLPDLSGKSVDAYISPPSYDWTMVFTHEALCGPYFTTKEWAASREPAAG